jgi:Ca2+-binding EF-hand superfamily protein
VEQVAGHLDNYSVPRIQRHTVRILLMPPIYSIDCWVSIRFNSISPYLTVVRELYEALCVWSFMALMIEFLKNVARARARSAHGSRALSQRVRQKGEALAREGGGQPPGAAAADEEAAGGGASMMMTPGEDDVQLEAAHLRELFDRFNTDGDEYIDADELKRALADVGLNLSSKEVRDVINEFDADGDGCLSFEEFATITALRITADDIAEAFNAIDHHGSGGVSARELRRVLGELGCSAEAAEQMLGPALGGGAAAGGAAAVASFLAAVLTEIYLCGIFSCPEILRRNGRGQVGRVRSGCQSSSALCVATWA